LPAHLFTRLGKKQCSLCGKVFGKESQPSVSEACAEPVRQEHKEKPANAVGLKRPEMTEGIKAGEKMQTENTVAGLRASY
jgi:hypothetical protein